MKFTQFNRDVIYFRADKLGFGFVWRRHNDKKNRLGWLKIGYSELDEGLCIRLVYCGYNPLKIIRAIRNWNLNKEWYEQHNY